MARGGGGGVGGKGVAGEMTNTHIKSSHPRGRVCADFHRVLGERVI